MIEIALQDYMDNARKWMNVSHEEQVCVRDPDGRVVCILGAGPVLINDDDQTLEELMQELLDDDS